ncbi:hypothetical protein AFM11_35085 [Mycolicibacterium wolinskyi]|uniref:DUF2637 domain-containing protein n=1 Tax=Mycolicibacterium wolinskyi TaxID=59750 RepID=A0A132PB80_9MYCO|nr:DUF2637 domain-containing protein [Mycolicibacterium wolinskyi]KWX19566.1 hypothetical protein AFM11_35085 [Mycolicibacterium wolinskyi]
MLSSILGSSPDAELKRARLFFWAVILLSSATSIAGNGAHTWVAADVTIPRELATAVAIAPPVFLILCIEGIATLIRTLYKATWLFWVNVAMTTVLATFAFILSFEALRDLAIGAGIPRELAFMWPVIVDVATAIATCAVVYLSRYRGNNLPTVEDDTENNAADGDAQDEIPDDSSGLTAITLREEHAQRAATIRSRRKLRKSTDDVQRVLALSDSGKTVDDIATITQMHPSTVRRILGTDRGTVALQEA